MYQAESCSVLDQYFFAGGRWATNEDLGASILSVLRNVNPSPDRVM